MADPAVGDSSGAGSPVNFRAALRGMFGAALERLSADGIVAIAAEDVSGLLEQVRETADPKFGDYSGTMAMALAKRAGKKPRDVAVEIINRLDVGGVMVNDVPTYRVDTFAYGGVKDSGFGSEGGPEGLDAYHATKAIHQA